MNLEQHIIRWVLVAPSLALILLFLPISGDGYQFAGIFDPDFLTSGTIDIVRVIVELVLLMGVALLLEQFVKPRSVRP